MGPKESPNLPVRDESDEALTGADGSKLLTTAEIAAMESERELVARIMDYFPSSAHEEEAIDYGSYEDALAEATEEIGQFELVEQKSLLAQPFLIVGVQFNDTDLTRSGKYVNVRCILPDDRKVCFNDGSTGVYRQLVEIITYRMNRGLPPKPILVKGGLRASVYHWDPVRQMITDDGKPNAATYYLSNSVKSSEQTRELVSSLGK